MSVCFWVSTRLLLLLLLLLLGVLSQCCWVYVL